MTDEVHEVVELLTARMESHPEEFRVADAPFHDRWYDHVNAIQAFGSEADKAAMAEGLRKIRLAETHERVMDELLNGEDRRRKEAEDAEYERHLAHAARQQQAAQRNALLTQHQMAQQSQGALNGAYANQLSSSLGQLGQASAQGLVGKSYTSAIMDEYDYDLDRYRSAGGVPHTKLYGGYGTLPVANGGTGSTIINKIKKALGKGE